MGFKKCKPFFFGVTLYILICFRAMKKAHIAEVDNYYNKVSRNVLFVLKMKKLSVCYCILYLGSLIKLYFCKIINSMGAIFAANMVLCLLFKKIYIYFYLLVFDCLKELHYQYGTAGTISFNCLDNLTYIGPFRDVILIPLNGKRLLK